MARKPNGTHRAHKKWVPSESIIIITHAKINGRAAANLNIYWITSFIINQFHDLANWKSKGLETEFRIFEN